MAQVKIEEIMGIGGKRKLFFFVTLGVVRKWGTYPKMAALL